VSKPIPRSATELARADALRKLVAQGMHPLTALDLATRPPERLRQVEAQIDRQVYRARPQARP
jgi:hypothetical protein